MRRTTAFLLAVLVSQVHSVPQFITFKEGKLGVNFGGYHAGVGLGGLLGSGAEGGLFAEAGTPFGQSAKAGLGGSVDGNGGTKGGLYAGATAGGNVRASAGLAGTASADKTVGGGFAEARAGDKYAASGLGGSAAGQGGAGFSFSGSKSFGSYGGVTKETEITPVDTFEVKPIHKKVHTEINVDAINEVNPVPLTPTKSETEVKSLSNAEVKAQADVQARANIQPVVVKEVYVQQPPQIIEKHFLRTRVKPNRHNFRKIDYAHGYFAGAGEVPPVYRNAEPAIQKRVDVGVESSANVDAAANFGTSANTNVNSGGGTGQVTYTKQVSVQRNPTFFQDIFNIPISTLKAVSSFLGNAAGNTNVSVQKTVQADSDSTSSKHNPSSIASQTHVSVDTAPVSKFIDDIFAIPINTLGAVNKFLENNVPARKTVQISEDGSEEPTRSRLGPHKRRRANRVVIVQESAENNATQTH